MIFPKLGKRPISKITAPDLLAALRKIEARGAHETTHRAKQRCGQIFRYAIATGRAENKFGVPRHKARDIYRRAASLPGLRVVGVDMHIGSQITELQPFDDAFGLLAGLVGELRADGHAIEHVDLGGGLGIPYKDDN